MSVAPEALQAGLPGRKSRKRTRQSSPSVQQPRISACFGNRRTTRLSTRKQTAVRDLLRKKATTLRTATVKKRRRSPSRDPSPSSSPENVSPQDASRKRRRTHSRASAPNSTPIDTQTVLSPIPVPQANARGSRSKAVSLSKKSSHNVGKLPAVGDENDEKMAGEHTVSQSDGQPNEGQLTMDFLHRVYDSLSTSFVPDEMKGREYEHKVIWSFLETCLRKRQANSMILVGSPGVGKTALVNSMLRKLHSWEKDENLPPSNVINVNAMRFSPANAIYSHLWNEVSPSKKRLSAFEASQKLEARFLCKKRSRQQKMTLVIVDEIDALLESSQTVLYKLFSWPKQLNSSLIVVGISNEIELTNLFLPRLSQRGCSPDLLVFDPYTEKQLSAILEHRIAMCAQSGNDGDDCLIERNAMTLITKKVASVSGDIRKGLEICRKAFRTLAEKASENSDSTGANQTVRVRFLDVMSVVRSFFASPFVDVVCSLPNHQQTALCVAVIMDREARGRYISVGDFLEFFSELSKRWDISRPAHGEFWDMIQALSSHGLVSVSKSKKAKKSTKTFPIFNSNTASSGTGTGGTTKKKVSGAPARTAAGPRKPKKRSVSALQRTMNGDSRNGVLNLIVSSDDVACAVEGNHMLTRLLKTYVEVPSKYYT